MSFQLIHSTRGLEESGGCYQTQTLEIVKTKYKEHVSCAYN